MISTAKDRISQMVVCLTIQKIFKRFNAKIIQTQKIMELI